MFELTNRIAVNLSHVSEITTAVGSKSVDGIEEDIYVLRPKMYFTMTNGKTHTVEGLADIHNYCEKTGRKRLWYGLIEQIKKDLNSEDEEYILSEEDKEYFNLEV